MSTFFIISYIALWILVVPLVILNLILFRQLGIFVMGTARGVDQSGIPVGRLLPKAKSLTLHGEQWSTETIKGRAHILLFGSPRCKECAEIMPYLESVCNKYNVNPTLLLFSEFELAKSYAKRLNLEFDVVHCTTELSQILDVEATPFAYAVDENGVIRGKGLVNDLGRLEFLAQSVSRKVA